MAAPKPFPTDLTTSDWVDYLQGLSRDEQIAALATYHRRIESGAKVSALAEVIDPAANDAVTAKAKDVLSKVPPARDYKAVE